MGEEETFVTNRAEESMGIGFSGIQAWWIDVIVRIVNSTIEGMGLVEKVLASIVHVREEKNSKVYP